MYKIIVHQINSVSEYCLDNDKTITEKKYLSNNKIKVYKYKKDNFEYYSILKIFQLKKLI